MLTDSDLLDFDVDDLLAIFGGATDPAPDFLTIQEMPREPLPEPMMIDTSDFDPNAASALFNSNIFDFGYEETVATEMSAGSNTLLIPVPPSMQDSETFNSLPSYVLDQSVVQKINEASAGHDGVYLTIGPSESASAQEIVCRSPLQVIQHINLPAKKTSPLSSVKRKQDLTICTREDGPVFYEEKSPKKQPRKEETSDDDFKWAEEDKKPAEPVDNPNRCPTCNKVFKMLARHKCKKAGDGANTSQVTTRKKKGLKSKASAVAKANLPKELVQEQLSESSSSDHFEWFFKVPSQLDTEESNVKEKGQDEGPILFEIPMETEQVGDEMPKETEPEEVAEIKLETAVDAIDAKMLKEPEVIQEAFGMDFEQKIPEHKLDSSVNEKIHKADLDKKRGKGSRKVTKRTIVKRTANAISIMRTRKIALNTFKCPECSVIFYQKKALDDHMKTHQLQHCEHCNKGFKSKKGYNAHVKKCDVKKPSNVVPTKQEVGEVPRTFTRASVKKQIQIIDGNTK